MLMMLQVMYDARELYCNRIQRVSFARCQASFSATGDFYGTSPHQVASKGIVLGQDRRGQQNGNESRLLKIWLRASFSNILFQREKSHEMHNRRWPSPKMLMKHNATRKDCTAFTSECIVNAYIFWCSSWYTNAF